MDWCSPKRLSSPIRYDFPGDRFIPNRSLMDLDHVKTLFTGKIGKKSPNSPFNDEYRKKIEENLTLDSDGNPFRMLVFRGMPVSARKSIRYIDEIRELDEQEAVIVPKRVRFIPKGSDRILDAPNLLPNFYYNNIEWGKDNIVAVALGTEVYIWDAAADEVKKVMQADGDDNFPTSVAWSVSNTKTLAIGFNKSEIQIWDAESSKLVRSLNEHIDRVCCLAWKGRMLTSGSKDRSIINHDVRVKNSLICRVRSHTDEVCGLKWSDSGNLLASGGNDNVIHIWDASNMRSSKFLQKFKDHTATVKALAWSPHEFGILASGGGSTDRSIKIWNVESGKCIKSINTESQVCGLEWNRHYKELLSGHGFHTNHVSLWRYPSMSKITDLKGHTDKSPRSITGLMTSKFCSQNPEGSTVISASADQTLRLWKICEVPKKVPTDSALSLTKLHIR